MANEWFYAACGKLQINDADPFIISFDDTFFRDIADQEGVNFEDLAILAILSPFFIASMRSYDENWLRLMPRLEFSEPDPAALAMVGAIYDVPSVPDYPSGRTSLACFTKDELKRSLYKDPPLGDNIISAQEWEDLVKQTPFDELDALLLEVSGEFSLFSISGDRATLKILPCTQQEIADLDPNGGLDAPRVDIFDLVKARLPDAVAYLDGIGLEQAKYYADGNYIEFVAECSLIFTAPTVPAGPY